MKFPRDLCDHYSTPPFYDPLNVAVPIDIYYSPPEGFSLSF
jgi:hypothetical protein